MNKVLIIGGTGTISTPIVNLLNKEKEVELTILNRGNHNEGLDSKIQLLKGDIRNNPKEVEAVLKGLTFDCVVNFVLFDEHDAKINYELFKDRTKQFIFISTNVVLDHATQCLINEESEVGNKISAYGQGKARAEAYLLDQTNFPLTIVRPTQTYSEHRIPLSVKGKSAWSVIDRMLKGKEVIVHGDGQSVWASTHADDFARFFVQLVGNENVIGETIQIINPQPHTWDQVYQTLATYLGVEYKPVYISSYLLAQSQQYNWVGSILGDKHFSNLFDVSKLKSIDPHFEFEISIEQGLKKYLEYMQEHPEQKVVDDEFDQWCDETIQLYKELSQQLGERIK